MPITFNKLSSSIIQSTLWCQPDPTRILWITMLAMSDSTGRVFASKPGLAHIARISLEDCLTALETFLSPDEYSRTELYEGRRIEVIEGGWRLLNHAKYRDQVDTESVRESKRRWAEKHRAKVKAQSKSITIHTDNVNIAPQKKANDF